MQSQNPNWWLIAHFSIKVSFNVSHSFSIQPPVEAHFLFLEQEFFLLVQIGFAS